MSRAPICSALAMKPGMIVVALTGVLLAGCADAAYYRKPGETQTLKCDKANTAVPWLIFAPLGAVVTAGEVTRFGDCKTRLEEAGYVRAEKDPAAILAPDRSRPAPEPQPVK